MGMLIYGSLSRGSVTKDAIVLLVFGIFWLLALIFAVFLISVCAELSAIQVRRKTMFGERTLQVSQLTSALITSGGRGSLFLTVRTASDRIMLSNSSFSNAQLREMHEFIRLRAADAGRQIQTTVPPPTARQVQMILAVYMGVLFTAAVLVTVFVIVAHQRKVQHAQHAMSLVDAYQSWHAA